MLASRNTGLTPSEQREVLSPETRIVSLGQKVSLEKMLGCPKKSCAVPRKLGRLNGSFCVPAWSEGVARHTVGFVSLKRARIKHLRFIETKPYASWVPCRLLETRFCSAFAYACPPVFHGFDLRIHPPQTSEQECFRCSGPPRGRSP